MKKLWSIFKASVYAVLALLAVGVVMTLMAWTKGLFVIVVIFGVLVWFFYSVEQRNARYKAQKARRGW